MERIFGVLADGYAAVLREARGLVDAKPGAAENRSGTGKPATLSPAAVP